MIYVCGSARPSHRHKSFCKVLSQNIVTQQKYEVIGTMPTYEYQCYTCNHRFEKWQKMTDEPLTTCPECSGRIRKVLYPAGVVFKGSGFYKTDHRSDNGAPHKEAKDETKKAEVATAESKTSTESKPEASKGSTASKTESSV
jgi:putative FmdB family regulatory protein